MIAALLLAAAATSCTGDVTLTYELSDDGTVVEATTLTTGAACDEADVRVVFADADGDPIGAPWTGSIVLGHAVLAAPGAGVPVVDAESVTVEIRHDGEVVVVGGGVERPEGPEEPEAPTTTQPPPTTTPTTDPEVAVGGEQIDRGAPPGTGSRNPLARTGADVLPVVAGALGAIAAGTVLTRLRRRAG